MAIQEIIRKAGDIILEEVTLVTRGNEKLSLLDYLVELNIYESMFSPGVTGNLVISDSKNLLRNVPILGEEALVVKVRTPSFSEEKAITKIFRIFSLKNKIYTNVGGTQLYTLNFASIEMFKDVLNPIYRSFSGKTSDIIQKIYTDYLSSEYTSDLNILQESANDIKYVSPGWSPIKNITWLCSKSLASSGKACNFLFWETTKGYYFGSTDILYRNSDAVTIGPYYYSASKVADNSSEAERQMFTVKELNFKNIFDQFKNRMDGYLGSTVVDINLFSKSYEDVEYNHIQNFYNYEHSLGDMSLPICSTGIQSNPRTFLKVNYSYPNLFSDYTENYAEKEKYIFGNRRSNLLEINNVDAEILIPGRTDLEAGTFINLILPKASPVYHQDSNTDDPGDDLYSGKYLITSINHKINLLSHMCTLSITKDAYSAEVLYG